MGYLGGKANETSIFEGNVDVGDRFWVSGLAGVNVTMPNTLDMLRMLDWACLAPRPQNRLAEPRSATGNKAPPAAASALSTPPI
jgi:hypothetical protein